MLEIAKNKVLTIFLSLPSGLIMWIVSTSIKISSVNWIQVDDGDRSNAVDSILGTVFYFMK